MGANGSAIVTPKVRIDVKSACQTNPQILKDYKIIDTTGAGDCFTSAFCVRLNELFANGQKVAEISNDIYTKCQQFANASAFLCITVMGAMPSQPLRSDVDKFMQKYQLI